MDISIIAVVVSIISVAFSIYFGFSNGNRSDSQRDEERIRENTTLNVKLDNVLSSLIDIKNEMNSTNNIVQRHSEKLISIDSDIKGLDRRISELEKK